MPLEILLTTTNKFAEWSQPSDEDVPGKLLVFTDNVHWQRIDGHYVQGPNGFPILAGTHSGTNRIVRVTEPGDGAYPPDVVVQEHEATWVLNAVPIPGTQPPQQLTAGQVTVRGVLLHGGLLGLPQALQEQRFAITGGTGHYALARGTILEDGDNRTMTIEL
jgi:hypothetical protein